MRKRIGYSLWDTETNELVESIDYGKDEIQDITDSKNHSVCPMIENEDGYMEYEDPEPLRYIPVKVTIEEIE